MVLAWEEALFMSHSLCDTACIASVKLPPAGAHLATRPALMASLCSCSCIKCLPLTPIRMDPRPEHRHCARPLACWLAGVVNKRLAALVMCRAATQAYSTSTTPPTSQPPRRTLSSTSWPGGHLPGWDQAESHSSCAGPVMSCALMHWEDSLGLALLG